MRGHDNLVGKATRDEGRFTTSLREFFRQRAAKRSLAMLDIRDITEP
jgi:hypothetical protein